MLSSHGNSSWDESIALQYFVVPPTFSARCAPLSLLLREGDRARLRARSAGVLPFSLPWVLSAVVTLGLDTRPGRFPFDSRPKRN